MLKKQCCPDLSFLKKTVLFVIIVYITWITTFLVFDSDDTTQSLSLEEIAVKNFDNKTDSNDSKLFVSNLTDHDHDEKVNLKYCGEKTCNFMFPYEIPEQETRANIHLRSLTFLAESLNRIMVLPNVGNSKMNVCKKFSFEFYYDLEKMKKMFPKIKFITQQTFIEWTKELLIKPDTLHAWLVEDGRSDSYPKRNHKYMAMDQSKHFDKKHIEKLCLDQFDLNISDYIEIHSGIKHIKDFELKMFDFLTKTLQVRKSPVILLRNRCRRQMFPLIEEPMPFAPHILNQATEISNKLHPYYCIHWRMEQGIPKKMPSCASELIGLINRLKKKEGINNIYLATDYPISGGKSASSTFHGVGKYHESAIRMLNSTFDLNTWFSLNAFKEFRNDKSFNLEFNGSGIHGILDKLICIQSDYFISGSMDCCRIRSTYTRLISKEREELIESGDTKIRNIITRWKRPQ